jgi:hypothetical protein
MSWEVTRYDQVKAGLPPAEQLPEKEIAGVTRTQCPCCGGWKLAFVLIDISALPASFLASLPAGVRWACDGCWTRWEREGRDCAGACFNEARMYEHMGAPQAMVDKVQAVIDARTVAAAASAPAADAKARSEGAFEREGVRNLSEFIGGGV